MSSQNFHSNPRRSSEPATNSSARSKPSPLLHIDPAHSHLLTQVVSDTSEGPGVPFPSTPTPTLGGQPVPHAQPDEGIGFMFDADRSAETGSVQLLSPVSGRARPPGPSAHSHRHSYRSSRYPSIIEEGSQPLEICDDAFVRVRQEADAELENVPPPTHAAWARVFDRATSLVFFITYFASLPLVPSTPGSAYCTWKYYVTELASTLTTTPEATAVLKVLLNGSNTILAQSWTSAIQPAVDNFKRRRDLPPTNTTQETTTSIRDPTFSELESLIPSPFSPAPASPWSFSESSHQAPTGNSRTPHLFIHTNRAIGSTDPQPPATPLSWNVVDESSSTERARADRERVRMEVSLASGTTETIRVSSDSLKRIEAGLSDVQARLEGEIQGIADHQEAQGDSSSSEFLRAAVSKLKGMRRGLVDALRGTSLSGSRSASPSPAATPILAGGATTGNSARMHQVAGSSLALSSLPSDALSVPARFSPHLPWETTPYSNSTQRPLQTIRPSDTSGKYRLHNIQKSSTATPPSPMPPTDSLDSDTRPMQEDREAAEIEGLVQIILTKGSSKDLSDPNVWLDIYEENIGHCEFACVHGGNGGDTHSGVGSSTSLRRLESHVSCINPQHHDLDLTCTLPTPLPIQVDLAPVMRQLERSQGSRVSQLMSIVSRVIYAQMRRGEQEEEPQGGTRKGKERANR